MDFELKDAGGDLFIDFQGEKVEAARLNRAKLPKRAIRPDRIVLDFYAVVDSYRAVYDSRVLAALNALLPPNVFYLEIDSPLGVLRAKVAVMSSRDFERATAGTALRPSTGRVTIQAPVSSSPASTTAGTSTWLAAHRSRSASAARSMPLPFGFHFT